MPQQLNRNQIHPLIQLLIRILTPIQLRARREAIHQDQGRFAGIVRPRHLICRIDAAQVRDVHGLSVVWRHAGEVGELGDELEDAGFGDGGGAADFGRHLSLQKEGWMCESGKRFCRCHCEWIGWRCVYVQRLPLFVLGDVHCGMQGTGILWCCEEVDGEMEVGALGDAGEELRGGVGRKRRIKKGTYFGRLLIPQEHYRLHERLHPNFCSSHRNPSAWRSSETA